MWSDLPYGNVPMLLRGEGSEAAEPYNKYYKYFLTFFVSYTIARFEEFELMFYGGNHPRMQDSTMQHN